MTGWFKNWYVMLTVQLGGTIAFVGAVAWLANISRRIPVQGVVPASGGVALNGGTYVYSELALFLIYLVVLCLLATVLIFLLNQNLVEKRPGEQSRLEQLTRDLNFISANNTRIVSQSYGEDTTSRLNFDRVHWKLEVNADSSTTVTMDVTLRTTQQPAHFWQLWMEADPESDKVYTIDGVDLELSPDAAPMILENKPAYKKFAIFFLPAIPANSTRDITIKYHWPRFFKQLLSEKHAKYVFGLRTQDRNHPTHLIWEAHFPKSFGNVQCKSIGAKVDRVNLSCSVVAGGHVWKYENRDEHLALTDYQFLLETG